MPLSRVREPFDDSEWFFELKYDGFRALAYVNGGGAELSRAATSSIASSRISARRSHST
jgi:hypothetical protein